MIKTTLMISLASLLSSGYQLDSADSAVEALARGPAGITVTAKSKLIRGEQAGGAWTFTVPASSLETGLALRDDQLSKSLESDIYPDVLLSVPSGQVSLPGPDDEKAGTVQSKMKLHGLERNVDVNYYAASDCEGNVFVRAKLEFELTDFGVTPPSYLGINVKPHVEVTANIKLTAVPSL